jgi:predicted transcriptional regulator
MVTTTQAEDLRQRRERLYVTRGRLAALTQISPAHITQIEQGYRPRRGDAVDRIDQALTELERTADQLEAA